MKGKFTLSCLLFIIIFILTGCSNKQQTVKKDKSNHNTTVEDYFSETKENSDADVNKAYNSIEDNKNNTKDDFSKEDIKEFILYSNTLADKIIYEGTSSEKVIGKYDNTNVTEINGEYNTFNKVKKLLGDYYTDSVIETELCRRYFVNLYGKIGEICASGENSYFISEKSQINVLVDEPTKKIIEMNAFNDNDDIIKVEYTLEMNNENKWMITDEKGFFNVNVNEIEKQLFYNDEFSLMASSIRDNYPPLYVLDDDPQTAWVEGVKGSGIGEWLAFKALENQDVSGIKIINGYAKSDDLYYANNRVKKIKIELPDNTIIEKVLEDGNFDYQTIEFDKVVGVKNIKITILDVYLGSKYNDTCISEIRVYR